jgi:hypothetical protein
MGIEDIEEKFGIFKKTNITLETSVEEKRKIIEENKNKKALIKIKDMSERYTLGIIVPKNGIFFGIKTIKPKTEHNYCEVISYKELSELILYHK